MARLPLVYGPDPIFQQIAKPITVFDQAVAKTLQDMADTLYYHNALGIGANMVGILEQLVVVDLQEGKEKHPLKMVNPLITSYSSAVVSLPEASLSFPGIQVVIQRPAAITVCYQDETGKQHDISADGMLARVIQHEIDYLQGKTFLEHISPTKKKRLLAKRKRSF